MKFFIAAFFSFIISLVFMFKSGIFKIKWRRRDPYPLLWALVTFAFIAALYPMLVIGSVIYYNTVDFNVNNKHKYIIYSTIPVPLEESSCYYYETNFLMNTINIRYDTDEKERIYHASVVKSNIDEIEEIVKEVISDDNNLIETTVDDKQEFIKNEIYTLFHIKTHDGKIYYVRNWKYAKRLFELVKDFEDKTSL